MMHIGGVFRIVEFVKDFTVDGVVLFPTGTRKLIVNVEVLGVPPYTGWRLLAQAYSMAVLAIDVEHLAANDFLAKSNCNTVDDSYFDAIRNHPDFERYCNMIKEMLVESKDKLVQRRDLISQSLTEAQSEIAKVQTNIAMFD